MERHWPGRHVGVGRQGCVYEPKAAGTPCRAGTCKDGEASSKGVCDGTNAACPEPEVTSCGLYVGGADACLSSCATDDDCAEGAVCSSRSCVVEDTDAGVDGGDEEDAGADGGEDASTDAGDEDADSDAGDERDAGEDLPDAGADASGADPDSADAPSEESDEGCSCRAVGGKGASNHAGWIGLGLAALAMTRRRRGGSFTS